MPKRTRLVSLYSMLALQSFGDDLAFPGVIYAAAFAGAQRKQKQEKTLDHRYLPGIGFMEFVLKRLFGKDSAGDNHA